MTTTPTAEYTTGICMFAYNNTELDYTKFARLCASYVKKNMKHNNICLITSHGDYDRLVEQMTPAEFERTFDDVVITATPTKQNIRQHYDSPWSTFSAQFTNSNKHKVFEFSPYDRTLMIDIDYLINNDNLDYIFDTEIPLAMYHDSRYVDGELAPLPEQYINVIGIPMLWSTVVYFDKSEHSRLFFELWNHVADNYEYYTFLYGFSNTLFRTDFCVSIAAHILNGFVPGDYTTPFKDLYLINSTQKDDLVRINNDGSIVVLANDRKEAWKNYITVIENTNIHIMNKRALMRHYDSFMKVCKL